MIWIIRIGLGLAWLIGTIAALFFATWVHIDTELGHQGIVSGFNHGMDAALDGRMEMGSVSYASLTTVHANEVKAFDPQGEVVLAVARARATVPWWTMIGGKLKLENVQAYDGRVIIRRGEHESTSISEAFSTTGGKPKSERDTSSSMDIDTGWMFVRNVRLVIAMNRRIVFGSIRASTRVTRTGESPVEVDIREAYTVLVNPAPLGATIRIMNARADIRPKTATVLDLYSGACFNSHPMSMHLTYGDHEAHLEVDKEDGLGTLASLGMRLYQHFSSTLSVDDVELDIPLPDCPGGEPETDEEAEERHQEAAEQRQEDREDADEAREEAQEDADEEREERQEAREDAAEERQEAREEAAEERREAREDADEERDERIDERD